MAKFKAYDYRQRVFLPVSLEDQLMPGTLEFATYKLVEDRLERHANLSTTQRYLGKVSDVEAVRWIENLYG